MRQAFVVLLLFITGACSPSDSKLVSGCEAQIKERLRSPSTYNRISVREYSEPVPADVYIQEREKLDTPRVVEYERGRLADGSIKPTNHIAIIEYDAANVYGTPIRSFSKCEYRTSQPRLDDVMAPLIKVDGATNLERLTNELLKRRGG